MFLLVLTNLGALNRCSRSLDEPCRLLEPYKYKPNVNTLPPILKHNKAVVFQVNTNKTVTKPMSIKPKPRETK